MKHLQNFVACKVLFSFLFLSSITTTAQQLDMHKSDSATIVELEHKWVQVALDGDADTFASMMADSYVGLYPNGKVGRKKGWVEAIRSGKNKYNEVIIYDLKVYLYENTAIVLGKYREKAVKGGVETSDTGSYMDTWAKVNGQWLVVASAFTDAPKEVSEPKN